MIRAHHLPWVLLALSACGGAGTPPEDGGSPARTTSTEVPLPKGSLARADVVSVVDGGLGRFLQRARVEPTLDEGRFVGFRVIELVPDSFWGQTDLRPGDVVTHVNGTSIEDPNQAYEVFESLRTANGIEVRLLREGQARTLRFPIVGAPAPKKTPVTGS
jgi:S1-C subfamily serine protease